MRMISHEPMHRRTYGHASVLSDYAEREIGKLIAADVERNPDSPEQIARTAAKLFAADARDLVEQLVHARVELAAARRYEARDFSPADPVKGPVGQAMARIARLEEKLAQVREGEAGCRRRMEAPTLVAAE
jgi:hypothetical protein